MPSSPTAGQRWSGQGYARHARFVATLGRPLLALLGPRPGERVLDLGCGDGALTAELAAAGVDVVGFDASPELAAVARARGLAVVQGDGQALPFAAGFDAVFSNAALHWMLRPDDVIAGVARALKPGGRFVGEFGGMGNVAAIATALRAALLEIGLDGLAVRPWFFPSPADYRRRLEAHGFAVEAIELIPRPTSLPTGMAGWLETFGEPFLRHAPKGRRAAVTARAIGLLEPALRDAAGNWTADYVRLRFCAMRA